MTVTGRAMTPEQRQEIVEWVGKMQDLLRNIPGPDGVEIVLTDDHVLVADMTIVEEAGIVDLSWPEKGEPGIFAIVDVSGLEAWVHEDGDWGE